MPGIVDSQKVSRSVCVFTRHFLSSFRGALVDQFRASDRSKSDEASRAVCCYRQLIRHDSSPKRSRAWAGAAAQPEPVTTSEKAAVKFKPQLKLSNTCHPYAAVDAHGYISGGLNSELHIRNNCGGSDLGAQIYARSAWHSDVWATVYAWYFPKNSNNGGGPRSLWMYAIIWVGGPGVGAPEVVGATLKTDDDTEKHAPVDADYIDGTSFECKFTYNFWTTKAKLTATKKTGGYQDLITWEQLPEVARTGLAGYADMPLLNGTFEELLTNGWPF